MNWEIFKNKKPSKLIVYWALLFGIATNKLGIRTQLTNTLKSTNCNT